MICVTGINSSGTNWLSALVALAGDGAGQVVIEPWSPQAWSDNDRGGNRVEYWGGIERNVDLLGRWPGRNENPNRVRIIEALGNFEEAFPEAVGFKTLYFHHWFAIRERWPEVKFISIERDLQGWLGSMARRDGWMFAGEGTWTYPLADIPPWIPMAEAAMREADAPEAWFPLVKAAYYRHVEYHWREAHEPEDVLHTSFEALAANWDTEAARILDYCGLPVPADADLLRWASVIPRWWADKSYRREDVFGVIALLRERGDCRCA